MFEHEKINYVEFPAEDLEVVKLFYSQVFGWKFEDFGPDYVGIVDGGLGGGFYRAKLKSTTATGGALVVIYSENLEQTQQKIVDAGGKIVKDIFSFPGGSRFHFSDPNGNELAVWSMNQE